MRRIDNNNVDIKESEIIAFSCVRNEILRLPYFIEYHRELGVDRFIFIDNGSTDGTTDFLLAQNDSNVFYTEESYAGSNCGVDWINELLSDFGHNHWVLTLDSDELLIYPMCESINLQLLTKFLDMTNDQAIVTFMLDMYSETPIKDTSYTSGSSFVNTCEYFDSDSYHEVGNDNIPIRGGPRHRLFWHDHNRKKPSPVLKKIPLVKWRHDLHYAASTHVIENVRLATLTGIVQHFKLFSDFFISAKNETERKEHWDNAAQYESYWDILRKNPDLSAFYNGSIKYSDSMQLVRLGMMKLPSNFITFASNHIE
jgi:glycosyltransferase involved in cell wall biosynthesis